MTHVKTEAGEQTWCGQSIGNEFYFKNAEFAALSGLHEPKWGVCKNCLHEIIAALETLREAVNGKEKSETNVEGNPQETGN